MSTEEQQPAPQQPIASGEYAELLKSKGLTSIPLGNDSAGVEMFEVKAEDIKKTCEFLKDIPGIGFDYLILLTSLETKNSYQVAYTLQSTKTRKIIRVKVNIPKENPVIPSVSSFWETANWYEREAYDMMGIKFSGHPNLKRILNPENWEGYPLRKDYIPPTDLLNGPHPLTETAWAEKTMSKQTH